jgi:SAM-dependent methyltransferase
MKSSPETLIGGTPPVGSIFEGSLPPTPRAPSFPAAPFPSGSPSASHPPTSIIDTERQTPVPGVSPEVMAQMPPSAPLPQLDLEPTRASSSVPPAQSPPSAHGISPAHRSPPAPVVAQRASSSIPSGPLSGPLGQLPEPSPFETALASATEPEEAPHAEPAVLHEAAVIANPIRAMRVIRIEETKKRFPSIPVQEAPEPSPVEAETKADVPHEEDVLHEEESGFAPPPEDAEPISEVEPFVDVEATDPLDSIEVDIEPVALPPRPPAPSTGPVAPGREPQPEIPPADRKPPPPRRSTRPALPKATNPRKKAWWETIFGDDFSRAYRPMSPSQLGREVDFILDGLNLPRGAVILDLACGQGEICVELARRGYSVVGYDLSVYQLAMAGDNAQQAKQKINFLQGDMREMAFEEMFDAVLCWDTSFGYFEDEKNVEVLHRIKKALKPGGRFLLDVMNRDFAAREAPYNHWFEGDGCVCMDDMSLDWITNRLRVKRSIILDDGRSKELQYSTRLYTLSEIGRILHEVGFRVSAVSGDVHTKGAFFGPHSRRIIIQAGKP